MCVYGTENHKMEHQVKKHPVLLICLVGTKHFVQKGNYMCPKWKKGSMLTYHTEPAALHVWSIDRTLQVNNPTLVWAQPRGAHCTGS